MLTVLAVFLVVALLVFTLPVWAGLIDKFFDVLDKFWDIDQKG